MNILNLLNKSPKTALIQNNKPLSYSDLLGKGLAFGERLLKENLSKGDKILLFTPLSIDLYIIMIGAWSVGVTPIFVDFSRGSAFVSESVARLQPELVIVDRVTALVSRRYPALAKSQIKTLRYTRPKTALDKPVLAVPPEHPAIMTLTSGTTGAPKTIVRSHGFLINQYHMLCNHLDFSAHHIDLGTLAVFTLANLAAGMTTVLPNKTYKTKNNPQKLARLAHRHQVSRLIASPTLAREMLAHGTIPSLERIYLGGAPVYPSVMKLIPYGHVVYGSTEAEPIACLPFEQVLAIGFGHGLPVGKPVIPCKIVDGEIMVSGETVIGDGWHATGDAGFIDSQGVLHLLGKVKHCIHDERGTVYPFLVELALDMQFGIRGAVVAKNGKRVLVIEHTELDLEPVIVQGQEQFGLDEIILHRLEHFELDSVHMVKKLPMDKRHRAKIEISQEWLASIG